MPAGNGTGPAGMGPMTGRAAGYCAGAPTPGYANPIPGRGFQGRGGGFGGGGRGRRNMYYATGAPGWARSNMGYPVNGIDAANIYRNVAPRMSPEQEIEFLKNQATYMQDNMNAVNERIKELENKKN